MKPTLTRLLKNVAASDDVAAVLTCAMGPCFSIRATLVVDGRWSL